MSASTNRPGSARKSWRQRLQAWLGDTSGAATSPVRRTTRLHLEPLEDRDLLSVHVVPHHDFEGLFAHRGDSGAPPDTSAAVGPNRVVEVVNSARASASGQRLRYSGSIAFFDKRGHNLFGESLN